MNKIKKMVKIKSGQTFSADIVVVIVILLFGVLFLVAHKVSHSTSGINDFEVRVSDESKVLFENLRNNKIISESNEVNLESLKQLDIDKMREDLSIKGRFCIVFEKDGKLVRIDPERNINGVGDKNIIVNGVPCYTVN